MDGVRKTKDHFGLNLVRDIKGSKKDTTRVVSTVEKRLEKITSLLLNGVGDMVKKT